MPPNNDPTRDPGHRDPVSDSKYSDPTGEPSYNYQPTSDPYDEPGGLYDDSTSEPRGYSDPTAHIREMANPNRHRGEPGGLSGSQLKNKEEGTTGASKASRLAAGGLAGLAKAEGQGNAGSGDTPFSYTNNGPRLAGARSFFQKHRKKIIASSLAGAGLLPIIAMVLFILGSLKLPHFIENVAAWRFAKLTRQYRQSMSNVMEEKSSLDSLPDEEQVKAKAKYGKYATFDKVNRLRPNRVLQSLQTNDRVQYNYKTTLTGRQKLTSITFAPNEDTRVKVTVKVPSGKFDRIIHPIRTIDRYHAISEALNSAMKAHDPKIPLITRSLATKQVLKAAGASLKGMAASRYLGKSNQSAVDAAQKAFDDSAKKLEDSKTKVDALQKEFQKLLQERGDYHASEYLPVFQESLAAGSALDFAFKAYEADPTSSDLMRAVLDAGERWQKATDALDAKAKIYADMGAKLDAVTKDLGDARSALSKAFTEHNSLIQDLRDGVALGDRDAKIAIEQEAFEVAHRDGGIAGLTSENMREVADEANQTEKDAVKDNKQIGDMIDKGQDIPDSVNQVVEKSLNANNLKSFIDTAVKYVNPVYDIAVPVCMAYDGSKITSESVDAHHDAVVSEGAYVLAANDQQKLGATFNAPAANAMNWKLGNIQESNAIRRVSGKPVDTTEGINGQRTTLGTYGEYTIFDVFHMGVLNSSADKLCPVLSNFWVGAGLGVVSLGIKAVAAILSGGTAPAVEQSAEQAAKTALTTAVKNAIKTATKKTIRSFGAAGRFAKKFASDTAKYGAATAAATFLASMVVHDKMGNFASGLEHDVAFTDNVDEGVDALSSDMDRENFYGRALNNEEIANSHNADRAEVSYNNERLSAFDRYLALENPNSLATRMIITTGSLLNRSAFASILNSLASLFNPIGLSSKLFATANAQGVLAAGTKDTEDYGNVQWGYSNAELNLMRQDSYASPDENAFLLDSSGQEANIEADYAQCYSLSIGKLLENHKLKRDESGDVLNQGDCSPLNLGPNNPKYGDLVFRWRLKHNYENTTDTLLGVQEPSKFTATNVGTLGGIPTGTAQQLAQQIIDNPNITFQTPIEEAAMSYIAQTGHARECGAPPVSPTLLGVLLAAAKKYKFVIGVVVDGHGCDSGYHPQGMAADLNGVSNLDGSISTGKRITGNNGASSTKYALPADQEELLRQFYGDLGELLGKAPGGAGMGQVTCFTRGDPNKNANVGYFTDVCNHLHIDVGTHGSRGRAI